MKMKSVTKSYIHARLGPEEMKLLRELKKVTGEADSALVREGLRLVYEKETREGQSALHLAGESVGRFAGPPDLSTHRRHLEDFGK